MLIGVSLSFLLTIATHELTEGTYVVKLSPQLGVAAGFLIGGPLAAITLVALRRRTGHKLLGLILPISYVAFVIVLLCVEFIS